MAVIIGIWYDRNILTSYFDVLLSSDTRYTTNRKELTAVRQKLPKPYFGDDAFDENQLALAEIDKRNQERSRDQETGESTEHQVQQLPPSQQDVERYDMIDSINHSDLLSIKDSKGIKGNKDPEG